MNVRVQVSIDEELLKKIDTFAKDMGLTRSSFLAMSAADYMAAKEKAPKLTAIFARMADAIDKKVSGKMTDEEYQLTMNDLQEMTESLKN